MKLIGTSTINLSIFVQLAQHHLSIFKVKMLTQTQVQNGVIHVTVSKTNNSIKRKQNLRFTKLANISS